ncbi:GIY-YIG nuclease family protein [Enterococcus termitis]|uniref:Excinuclease ABC n=1 Tax=Enterococcus termitis TaxID=332950 RepID=A0A1E5H6J1_9ENTE|nr:GIY-YIG nuclease family protein [Enterococcus termitis]OEG20544.1 excinuclease ABC [Enterococcus termitis]
MNTNLKKQAKALPLTPGVYLMLDKNEEIIYVGKAKKLRERVSSYFTKNKQHSRKTLRMIQQLADFRTIDVPTELDALLLECQLIQTHRPIYNRQMNSFEKYKYIEINTDNQEVQINILSVPTEKNCFGPFSIQRKLNLVKQILEELYGLNKNNYWRQTFMEQSIDSLDRTLIINELLGAFRLNNERPQERLEAKMLLASENFSFEKAGKLHEEWQFLTHFFNQNKKLILASQTDWQFLWFPFHSKISYYLIYQGQIINSRMCTKQTFSKYTADELAKKILPKIKPTPIKQFSKKQIDFVNILYSYVNQHKECHLIELDDPFT